MKKILAAILVTFTLTGTALADSKYNVNVSAPSAKVSQKSVATVKVTPGSGYHMNLEYPTKLKLTTADGVTLEKTTLAKADGRVSESSVEFDVSFTAARAGKTQVTGEIKFAVCKDTECLPQTEKVTIDVDAK